MVPAATLRRCAATLGVVGCAGFPYDERPAPLVNPQVAPPHLCSVDVSCVGGGDVFLTVGTEGRVHAVQAWLLRGDQGTVLALQPASESPCGSAGWRGEATAGDTAACVAPEAWTVVAFGGDGSAVDCLASGALPDPAAPDAPWWAAAVAARCSSP